MVHDMLENPYYHKRREANGEDEFAFILPRTGVELLGDTPDREKYKRYYLGKSPPMCWRVTSHRFIVSRSGGSCRKETTMKRTTYGERDYTFGQAMLTLRTNIGLTQAGLGEKLGISRRAIAEWEAGSSYPKAERLKLLIELGVQLQAFPAGREAEEIRAFWHAAHQKMLLDETWLHDLVGTPVPVQLFPQAETLVTYIREEPATFPRIDWVGALDVNHFAGRE